MLSKKDRESMKERASRDTFDLYAWINGRSQKDREHERARQGQTETHLTYMRGLMAEVRKSESMRERDRDRHRHI